jgi:regulatory protein
VKAEVEEETIEAVLAHLQEVGLLDDAQYSRDWVESRSRSKGIGRVRLAQELRRKGVDSEETDNALEDLVPEAEVETALRLAEKKIRGETMDDPAERQAVKRRLAGYLQRRGYNWSIIEQVFVKIFANRE